MDHRKSVLRQRRMDSEERQCISVPSVLRQNMGKEIEPGKDPNMPMLGRWKLQEAPMRDGKNILRFDCTKNETTSNTILASLGLRFGAYFDVRSMQKA